MATILPADEFSCAYIAANLRPLDAKEAWALRPHQDPVRLGNELAELPAKWIVSHETRPAAVVGFQEWWPGMYNLYLFTTPEFPKVVLAFTKFVRQCIIPHLLNTGANRAQVHVLAEYEGAKGLLRILGAKPEGRIRQFGRNGEDFELFAWVREDFPSGRYPQGRFSRTG